MVRFALKQTLIVYKKVKIDINTMTAKYKDKRSQRNNDISAKWNANNLRI